MKRHANDHSDTAQRQPTAAPGAESFSGRRAIAVTPSQRRPLPDFSQSPRMLAQRRALKSLFGPAMRLPSDILENRPPAPTDQRAASHQGESAIEARVSAPPAAQRTEASADPPDASGKAHGGPQAAPALNQTGMPDSLKTGIESLSGMDLSHVRVHRNSDRPAELRASAYAQGNDIYLGPGQEQHLAHEAWHVVQQAQARVRPTVQMQNGLAVNDDRDLEREADEMGARALQMKTEGEDDEVRSATEGPELSGKMEVRPALNVIQGFFGFEMELPVLLTEVTSGGTIKEPDETYLFDEGDFEVHKDHMKQDAVDSQFKNRFPDTPEGLKQYWTFKHGASIVELANKKMDETTLTETQVGDQMQAMADYADDILNNTNNLTSLYNLKGNLYVGANGSTRVTEMIGNAQVTYGIRLTAVPEAFRWSGESKASTDSWAESLVDANAAANAVIEALSVRLTVEDTAALRGLMALMCSYLIAGRSKLGSGGLLKRHTGPLFYKTHLNELRKELGDSAGAGLYISEHDGDIKAKILEKVGRAADDKMFPVFHSLDLKCGVWIDEVLSGTGDTVAEEGIDSAKLGPDKLGPTDDKESGPVIENRRPTLILPTDLNGQWYKTSKWAEMGKAVYKKLRKINLIE